MKPMVKMLLAISIGFIPFMPFAQPKIIFDTDFGADADDLGALAMLNNFINKKECKLLAVMSCSGIESTVSAIDAVNRYYKHKNIPIGTNKAGTFSDSSYYSNIIAQTFPHQLSYNLVPDATILYRQILAKSKNKSIIIVAVGPLKNIKKLLESSSDSISKFSGKELIEKKVKEFVIMGGNFPEGAKETNFIASPGLTKFVIENITVPITFSGYEVGLKIKTGAGFNNINPNTPLYVGFNHFSKYASWMKHKYTGKISNNSTYDQTAVLYAVRNGTGKYWDKVENGICIPDDFGGNKWVDQQKTTTHSYLKLKMSTTELATIIESFMIGNFEVP